MSVVVRLLDRMAERGQRMVMRQLAIGSGDRLVLMLVGVLAFVAAVVAVCIVGVHADYKKRGPWEQRQAAWERERNEAEEAYRSQRESLLGALAGVS